MSNRRRYCQQPPHRALARVVRWIDTFRIASLISVLALSGCVSIDDKKITKPADIRDLTAETRILQTLSEMLERPVELSIQHRSAYESWSFLVGHPINLDGSRIDITTTDFSVDYEEGYFDDIFMALINTEFESGHSDLIELEYGATDAPFIAWIEQYKLPNCLFSRTENCN